MKLSTYALDHLVSILIYLLFLICLELFLLIFDVHVSIMIASFVLVMLFGGALLAYEYQRRSGYYRRLFAALDQLDQKYLVHELTSSPSLETPIFISLTSGTRPIACRAICESAVRDMCTCAPSSELTVINDAGTRFLFLPKIIITI